MAEFNPDEYLAEKKNDSFDPDAYLQDKAAEKDSDLKMLAREAVKVLPMAGSVGGALIAGGPTLGTAALAGSAGGAMLGKAAQTLIEENLLDVPQKSIEQKFMELPTEAAYDVVGNITGEKVVAPLVGATLKPLTKIASSLSGVPEKAIETYAKNFDEVNAIDDVALEADLIRQRAQDDIAKFKNVQNSRISEAISQKSGTPVNISKTRESLVSAIGKLDNVVDAEKISKIHKQIQLIDQIGQAKLDGDKVLSIDVPAEQAYSLQKHLQELAEYLEPGQVFKKKNFVDLSLSRAAAETRTALNKVVPEISQANAELAKLRRLDKNINKNLIVSEKPMNALISVGSGQNPTMQRQVEKLGAITGNDYLTPMQNLAASQKLGTADYISGLTTGRASIPFLTGSAVGSQFGPIAGATSALMTTPIGIKTSIGVGRSASNVGLTPKNISKEAIQFYGPDIQSSLGLDPFTTENMIRKDQNLTPSQRAKLIKENSNR